MPTIENTTQFLCTLFHFSQVNKHLTVKNNADINLNMLRNGYNPMATIEKYNFVCTTFCFSKLTLKKINNNFTRSCIVKNFFFLVGTPLSVVPKLIYFKKKVSLQVFTLY